MHINNIHTPRKARLLQCFPKTTNPIRHILSGTINGNIYI